MNDGALRALLAPTSVVVVGANPDPMTISGRVLDSLRRFGFGGEVFPVTASHDQIAGYRCFDDLRVLPEGARPEAAILAVPAEQVLEAASRCIAMGTRALTVIAGGFAESGPEGRQRQLSLRAMAEQHGCAVCGPNCLGAGSFLDGYPGFGGTALAGFEVLPRGSIGLICQSGGLANALVAMASDQGTSFSHVVSCGNEAVTLAHDYLRIIGGDARVRCVLAYLEQIREPERFLTVAEEVMAEGTPIVVLKAGATESGNRVAASHTASLAGSSSVVAAALRQVGIVQVDDVDDLLDTALILELVPSAVGDRVGVFSQIGGGAAMAADELTRWGLSLPALTDATIAELRTLVSKLAHVANPLDPIAGFARDRERFRRGLAIFAADPTFDVILFISVAGMSSYADALAEDLGATAASVGKPVVSVWMTSSDIVERVRTPLRAAGVPVYSSINRAVRSIARLRAAAMVSNRHQSRAGPVRSSGNDVRRALVDRGLLFPPWTVSADPDDLVAFAREVGPVALKVAVSGVLHKTDVGGVRLSVSGDDDVRRHTEELLGVARRLAPAGTAALVQAQAMARPGIEVLVGVRMDVEMGRYVCVGHGGVLTEVHADVACRVLPVDEESVRQMLPELRLWRVLTGFRGSAACDVDALVQAVLAVTDVAAGKPDLGELEVNPLIVHPAGQGCTAVDVVATVNLNRRADETAPEWTEVWA